ncbi:MAG TPA: dihydrofolate reductase family protein [Cyclobacteriaceae bacterium]|nr:dihydrofolate reductase family protein [Cyclobacteriaceae bacterium]
MAKLSVFNFISLDGYYKDANNSTDWHQHGGKEEGEFSEQGAQSGSILLFGRVTYEMMESFWPTPMAYEMFAKVADGMNKSEKIVFSKKKKKADWTNTKIINSNIVEEVKKLKKGKKHMTILGSGSIVTQLAEEGLIDTYMFMVDPIAIGKGTSIFKGLKRQLNLKLISSRPFKSGVVLNQYEPQ